MADENRFVIKYHASLLNLEALLEVFPGAQVLMGHRDFSECVPSLASLAKVINTSQWPSKLLYFTLGQIL